MKSKLFALATMMGMMGATMASPRGYSEPSKEENLPSVIGALSQHGPGGNGRKRAKLARQNPHSKYAKR